MHPNETALNDYVDDSLEPRERAGIEHHLGSCAACRQLVEDLREIAHAAGTLDPREPPVRGWSRLERAIRLEPGFGAGAPGVQSDGRAPLARLKRLARHVGDQFAVGVADWARRRRGAGARDGHRAAGRIRSPHDPPRRPRRPGRRSRSRDADAAESVETELRQAEEHYLKAINGLEQITKADENALDPQTVATVRKNVAVIDQAIGESRAALRSEPTSEPAQHSLIESFKAKVTLLQNTVALINEMQKGNEAGTARIVLRAQTKGRLTCDSHCRSYSPAWPSPRCPRRASRQTISESSRATRCAPRGTAPIRARNNGPEQTSASRGK